MYKCDLVFLPITAFIFKALLFDLYVVIFCVIHSSLINIHHPSKRIPVMDDEVGGLFRKTNLVQSLAKKEIMC